MDMSWFGTRKTSKLLGLDKSRIIAFDIETTGLSDVFDEIIQISIIDGYGNILFSSYIKPIHHKIWTEAQKINGIRYSMVKDAPTFKSVKKQIQNIFNSSQLVVGYNIGFDIGFLEAAGIVVSGARFDVMTEFASYRARIEQTIYRRCKLVECAEYFNYLFNPHNADEDAYATLHCFDSLISDDRFISYKKTINSNVNYNIKMKRKNNPTIAVQGGFFRSLVFGIVLIAIGIIIISLFSGICPKNYESIKLILLYSKSKFLENPKVIIALVFVVFGAIIIIVKVIRKILMIPIWFLVHIRRITNMFR